MKPVRYRIHTWPAWCRTAAPPLCSVCSKSRRCAHWWDFIINDGAALFSLHKKKIVSPLKLHHWGRNSTSEKCNYLNFKCWKPALIIINYEFRIHIFLGSQIDRDGHIQFIFYFIIPLIKLHIQFTHFASLNVADVPDEVQDEFTELQNDSTAHDLLQEKTLTEFWCAIHILMLRCFCYGYLCHLLLPIFGKVVFQLFCKLKQRPRNWLDVQDDMRLALTQTKPRISKLVTQMQPQS